MTYVPSFTNNSCCYIHDNNTLRCYDRQPTYNTTIGFTDYFINSHYLSRSGSTTFGNYGTISYDCLNVNTLTDKYYYRNDFDSILMILLIISIFVIVVPLTIVKRLFRRFK